MQIHTSRARTQKSRVQNSATTLGSANKSALDKVTSAIAENPMRTLLDVADVGLGSSLAFGVNFGEGGGSFVKGAGYVTGAAHAVTGFVNLVRAASAADAGYDSDAKTLAVRGVGDALAATGMFAAAAGVGPVSLAFLGVGAITATLAR